MKVKNNNNYFKKILSLIFVLVLFGIIFLTKLFVSQVFAATGEVVGIFCANNKGTVWQVAAQMKDAATGVTTGWVYVWANGTSANCSGYVNAGAYDFGVHDTGSTLIWHTACVDPVNTFNTIYVPLVDWYVFQQDITCSGNWLYGHPASCNNADYRGNVTSGATCPSSGGPYCMVGGETDGVICTGAFDGSGSDSCNGTTCTVNCTGPDTYKCEGTPAHCEKYTWAVRNGVCGSGPNGLATSDSLCNNGAGCAGPTTPPTITPTTPPSGNCVAGTGTTNTSCGPENTIVSYSINSLGVCCGNSWGCHGGNTCVLACHDINVSASQCSTSITCPECSGSTCTNYPYSGSTCPTNCNACPPTGGACF